MDEGEKKKYSFKDFLIDFGLAILGFAIMFVYGFVRGVLGYYETGTLLSLIIAYGIMGALLSFRPYSALIYSILNLNLIMILVCSGVIASQKKEN